MTTLSFGGYSAGKFTGCITQADYQAGMQELQSWSRQIKALTHRIDLIDAVNSLNNTDADANLKGTTGVTKGTYSLLMKLKNTGEDE